MTKAMTKTSTTKGRAASFDPFDGIVILTRHEDAPPPRPDFIATISAGFKDAGGVPVVSRDGTIHVSDPHDRAPGLKAALAEGEGKVLTITLPSDRMADVFFQHFRKEGKSRLEAHGDAEGITTIAADGARAYHPAGTPEFDRLRKECKVTYEIAFYLARWGNAEGIPRPEVYWPDGIGAYRLRTTSDKTANNFIACVRELAARTGGPVAGFPLEVRLVYPKVADKTGTKRAVPLFSFVVKPPGGTVMDAGQFRAIAVEAAAVLPSVAIAALPPAPTLDDAIEEFELLTVPMDANECRKGFFGITKGTHWGTDEGRAEFLRAYTNGRTDSLKTFLETATTDDMHELLDALQAKVNEEAEATGADRDTGEVIEADLVEEDPPAPPEESGDDEVLYVGTNPDEPCSQEQYDRSTELIQELGWGKNAGEGAAWLQAQFNKTNRTQLTRREMAQLNKHLEELKAAKAAAKSAKKEVGDA